MSEPILALNCGSSSIKFALFETCAGDVGRTAVWKGKVDGVNSASPTLELDGASTESVTLRSETTFHDALIEIRTRVVDRLAGRAPMAVAHRVVHGGAKYLQPARIDAAVLDDLRSYIPLAPLHQPFALEAISSLLLDSPELPQVACFDTSFHRTMPEVERILPLPFEVGERGLRRYGFHGLSYEYMSVALSERYGTAADGRLIVAHLGSGASLCAMTGLRSVATTMGFSALDGLMMGTRCGSIDPGVLLHLMEIDGLTPAEVGRMLYRDSGMLGVSGVSSDPRHLMVVEHGNTRVQLALAMYVRRIVREVGALTAVLGGLDMLVFTAGIGEHNAELRRRVCQELGFLGVVLDLEANVRHAPIVSALSSRLRVAVERTNEEWIAARHALELVASVRT